MTGTLSVLVVGLGFGRDFLHLYQLHPEVSDIAICDTDTTMLTEVGDAYGIADRYTDLDSALATGCYDIVHLATPVPTHAAFAVRVLDSGRSVGCSVPMGMTLADIDAVLAAANRSAGQYMMLETGVFSREYLHVAALRDAGQLGRLTFGRGAHLQDLDNFPAYWLGYPPMLYATHVLGPLLTLAGVEAVDVRCLGSGRLAPEHTGTYGRSFPWETALLRTTDPELALEATVSFFETARGFSEGWSVYGERGCFEWPQDEDAPPAVYRAEPNGAPGRGRRLDVAREHLIDRVDHLPEPLRPWTHSGSYRSPAGRLVAVSSTHGGSHPHLVHELVQSVAEGRPALVDEVAAARICAPGIVAHASALAGGVVLPVPKYARAARPPAGLPRVDLPHAHLPRAV